MIETVPKGLEYVTVAASQTKQVLGTVGKAGGYLAKLLIVPGTTSPGTVTLYDGTGSAIILFTGGATSVTNLTPIMLELNAVCTTQWLLSTGANVTVLAMGTFDGVKDVQG